MVFEEVNNQKNQNTFRLSEQLIAFLSIDEKKRFLNQIQMVGLLIRSLHRSKAKMKGLAEFLNLMLFYFLIYTF